MLSYGMPRGFYNKKSEKSDFLERKIYIMLQETVFRFLPSSYYGTVSETAKKELGGGAVLSEMRLRVEHLCSLTVYKNGLSRNVKLPFALSQGEMRDVFAKVCGGSVYAHEESIKEGYVTLRDGVRVGIGGKAVLRGGEITALCAVESLVFRIPHAVPHAADALLESFRKDESGILLFAPPGCGKTTLLREFAREISRGAKARRVAVIDTRGELCAFEKECLVDVLCGYPKSTGAEIALRTLSPEILLMDEIGAREVEALLMLSSLGVPVVASVHGKSAEELRNHAVGKLLRAGVFAWLWDVCHGRREAA